MIRQKLAGRSWRPLLLGAAGAVALAASLSACGSSSSSSSTSSAASTAATTSAASTSAASSAPAGASGTSGAIRVMQIVDYTTPNGRLDYSQLNGAQAAISAANAAGGIHGRRIILLHCDAHSSPSAAAACANVAIHSGVVALVGSQVDEDAITTPLLQKAGIPIIGNNPSTPPGRDDPNSACFVSGTVPTFVGMIAGLAKEDGVKKIGVLEPPIPGVQQINAAVKAAAAANGAQITNIVPLGFTVTNFGPPLQQVLSNGTQAIIPFAGGSPAALAALVQQAKQINPNLKFVFPSFELTPPFLAIGAPLAQGNLAVGYTQFSSATSSPGVAQFHQEISKVAPADAVSDPALWAWLGAHAFVKIADTISGPLTPASISAALKSTKNLDLGGVVPNYSYAFNTLGLGCLTNGSPAQGRLAGHGVAPLNGGNNLVDVMTPSVIAAVKANGG